MMRNTDGLNRDKLKRYIDAFIMFEIGNHGVDPRVTVEGTSMRRLKDEGYKYREIENWEAGANNGTPLFERIARAVHNTNLMDYHGNDIFDELLVSGDNRSLGKALEHLFYGDKDATAFTDLVEIIGARFDVLGFLFFLKDHSKYMPIRSSLFDQRLGMIGIDSRLSGNCSWEKYLQYNQWIENVRTMLNDSLNSQITLIDAHSFLWVLPWLEAYLDSGAQAVEHSKYGKGIVLGFEGDSILVKFGKKERRFLKDAAFKKGLLRFIPIGTDIYGKKLSLVIVDEETKKAYAEEDNQLINDLRETLADGSEEFEYTGTVKEKPEPVIIHGHPVYTPNRITAGNALAHAHYLCEIDHEHPTFIRKSSNKPYTEPHHLVPRAYQDQFDVLIDREENIVSLCSNWHNEIHYGRDARDLLVKLYNDRKELLKSVGIDITLEQLFEMYE